MSTIEDARPALERQVSSSTSDEEFILLGIPDVNGSIRGKALRPAAFQSALPPEVRSSIPPDRLAQLQNPQILLNPQIAATLRQQFAAQGSQGEAIFNTVFGAIKFGLVGALHDVFLLGTVLAGVGLVTVLFLEERPLRKSYAPPQMEGASDTAAQVGDTSVPSLPPLRPEDEPRLAPVLGKQRRAS